MLRLQFVQLQFILIISSYIFGVQTAKQEYQDSTSNGSNVTTAVANVNMPGKYYVHSKQHQQQQQKLNRNKLEKQPISSANQASAIEGKYSTSMTKISSSPLSTTLASSSSSSSSSLPLRSLRSDAGWARQQPMKNFFGIFNRNNAPQQTASAGENASLTNNNAEAHDTQNTLSTCSCR